MVSHFPYTIPPSQYVQTWTVGHAVEKSKCLTEVNTSWVTAKQLTISPFILTALFHIEDLNISKLTKKQNKTKFVI